MVETDVLGRLVDFLQDADSYVRRSSVNIIITLIELGMLIYIGRTRSDRAVEDFRLKMVETNVLHNLVSFLGGSHSHVRRSSIKIIATLTKFGTLVYFGIYKG